MFEIHHSVDRVLIIKPQVNKSSKRKYIDTLPDRIRDSTSFTLQAC